MCLELREGRPCSIFGACGMISPDVVNKGCVDVCSQGGMEVPAAESVQPDIRIAKGFGTKPYNQIRISVLSSSPTPPISGFFDYSAQFVYKWPQFYLHTAMKSVRPGAKTTLNIGTDVVVQLPVQGAGVAGILIADPCVVSSAGKQYIGCSFGDRFQTLLRTPALINLFAGSDEIDFWSISGDNFYDRTGAITSDVFNRISLEAKSKVFASVPGNHDYWVLGSPEVGSAQDQCGNGFMQYYGQDVQASEKVHEGSSAAPYDFGVHPEVDQVPLNSSVALGCKLPSITNFLWYNQIGNVGMIGQSGAYTLKETMPFMTEACLWAEKQEGLEVIVLFGHWDDPGLGALPEMAMPKWYTEMAVLPGCSEFDNRGMLKFVMGHTHCNDPHPHGKVGAGFRVAGFGMEGCGNYGVPIIDSTSGRIRFWYFDTSTDELYNEVTSCVQQSGWRQCTHLAVLWLDQALNPAPHPLPGNCPTPPDNAGCCTDCNANHYCPGNGGCYAASQPGCPGGYCPAPTNATTQVVVV